MLTISSISSNFFKKSIPLYAIAINPMPFPTTTNTIKFKIAQYGTPNYAYFSTQVMGPAHDPSYIPGKSPPEIPTAPPQHNPAVPPEVPRTPNIPDYDPIPPEKPADPPVPEFPGPADPPVPEFPGPADPPVPEFPGPADPIPKKPDPPETPRPLPPGEPEVVPPHGPDVIPPGPDMPPPIMGLGSTGFHFY